MWGGFEQSRYAMQADYETVNFKGGMPAADLQSNVSQIADAYRSVSVAKAKSEAIAYLLNHAGVEIPAHSIFAYRINHQNIMHDFFVQDLRAHLDYATTPEARSLQDTNAFRANMDFSHIAPDWNVLLNQGIPGILARMERQKEAHRQDAEKAAYYQDRITVYRAIQSCFLRFAEHAEAANTTKCRFIAGNMRHLSQAKPETLAEAFQLILIFYHLQTELDIVMIRSLGGLDRMLYPFYKNDLVTGRYSKVQLREIVQYFLWEISCMEVTANLPFYICGMNEKGEDATNEFTVLLLETYRALDIYDPKIHVLYHEQMDQAVLGMILESIREGKNSFVFINTVAASRALEQIGISHEDAKKVIIYGCYEPAAEGTEIPCTCAGMINLAKAVELALHNGRDAKTGRSVSLATGETFATFAAFYEAVFTQLAHYTKTCMETIAAYEQLYQNICPSLMMSPTYRSSMESGVDVYQGGAKYNNTSIVGAGLATLVDSIVVIKKLVFEEHAVSFERIRQILLSNWEEDPLLRLKVKGRYPKFGTNAHEADAIATDLYDRFSSLINNRPNGRGGVFRCGMFSVDWRFWMGEKTGATPDGRLCGAPLSKNLAASLGQDRKGVTAYLQSVLKLNTAKCPDGYVADVALHCSSVKGEEGMRAFEGLLKTFMEQGGCSVHFNILSPETLIQAQKEPEKHKNLQIRLCGWNVRFIDLDRAQQDEFILQSGNGM